MVATFNRMLGGAYRRKIYHYCYIIVIILIIIQLIYHEWPSWYGTCSVLPKKNEVIVKQPTTQPLTTGQFSQRRGWNEPPGDVFFN